MGKRAQGNNYGAFRGSSSISDWWQSSVLPPSESHGSVYKQPIAPSGSDFFLHPQQHQSSHLINIFIKLPALLNHQYARHLLRRCFRHCGACYPNPRWTSLGCYSWRVCRKRNKCYEARPKAGHHSKHQLWWIWMPTKLRWPVHLGRP